MVTKLKSKLPGKLPGKSYLIPFNDRPHAEKCACKSTSPMMPSGCWLVSHELKLYAFSPNTQIQKDIWLSEAREKIGDDAAIALLRWYCFQCSTVQAP